MTTQTRSTVVGLPQPVTPFIGRADLVAAVGRLLVQPESRLVSLVGPGGVGKTRLATRVAQDISGDFPDGVVFIGLAAITDSDLVPAVVSKALGAPELADHSCPESIIAFLGARRLLLVLDNLEHLLEINGFIADLIASAPHLTVLATSRVRLRLSGEHVVLVPPLAVPDPATPLTMTTLAEADAISLFLNRARAVRSDFVLTEATAPAILQICQLVDGLPLAIELAAARANVLSPQAMATRLARRLAFLVGGARDLPERQQTIRNTIAWSHDLLDPAERVLFRRLAVFSGGFSLEAAETVCGTVTASSPEQTVEIGASDAIFDGITSLVDKSLIRPLTLPDGAIRFMMLETIREFASEALVASGERDAVRLAHVTWGRSLADELWRRYVDAALDAETVNHLELEHDNVRAMLSWLESLANPLPFFELAGKLTPFWRYHTHFAEGRSWLLRALNRAENAPASVRAHLSFGVGLLTMYQTDYAEAEHLLAQSRLIWAEIGYSWGVATSLLSLGIVARGRRDFAPAAELLNEALALYRQIDSAFWAAITVRHCGEITYTLGDTARGKRFLQEALTFQQPLDDPMGLATVLDALGLVDLDDGNPAQAAARFAESLPLWRRLGSKEGISDWLARVATLAARRHDHELAACLFAAAQTLASSMGHVPRSPEHDAFVRAEHQTRASLTPTQFAAAWSASQNASLTDALNDAEHLLHRATTDHATPVRTLPGGLSEREAEVLRLLAAGLTNTEIADRLYLSPHTIRAHLNRIYTKLDLTSRTEAVRFALEHDLSSFS